MKDKPKGPPPIDSASLTPEFCPTCADCGNATFPIAHASEPDLFDPEVVEPSILTTGFLSVEDAVAQTACRLCAVKGGYVAKARPLASVLHALGHPAFASIETRPWDKPSAPTSDPFLLASSHHVASPKPESSSQLAKFNKRYAPPAKQPAGAPRLVASTKGASASKIGDANTLDAKLFPVLSAGELADRGRKLAETKRRKARPKLLKSLKGSVRERFSDDEIGEIIVELFERFDHPRGEFILRTKDLREDAPDVEVLWHLIDADAFLDGSTDEEFVFLLKQPDPLVVEDGMIDPDFVLPLEVLSESAVMVIGDIPPADAPELEPPPRPNTIITPPEA